MSETTTRTVAEIREELRAAEAREAAEQAARRDAVKPVYKFTLTPEASRFDKIYDPTIVLFKLAGTVTNKAELEAVGAKPDEGGIAYLFNTENGRFVMRTGGGRLWLTGKNSFEEDTDVLQELADYLTDNPTGGDVTEIVTRFREANGKA
jgi:hypothetical protein